LLLIFAFLIGPAAAVEEIHQENIEYFSLEAPDGLCISGFDADSISPDFNYSTVMNSYGETYTLNITGTKNWYGRWYFDVALLYPNGTVVNKSLSTTAISARTCDISVQYAFTNTESLEWANVDLYVGLLPLTASFTNPVSGDQNSTFADIYDDEYYYTRLMFSQIEFTCDSPADLTVYCSTEEEFQQQVNESISAYANELVGDAFSWTWDMVLTFVGKIPGVGPYLASVLEISAITLNAIIFYFDLLLIQYPETTFLTVESFILANAFCRRGNFWVKINRVCNSHIKLIELFIDLVQAGVNIISRIISAVADAINALKPV
jgi:hypothetical protein